MRLSAQAHGRITGGVLAPRAGGKLETRPDAGMIFCFFLSPQNAPVMASRSASGAILLVMVVVYLWGVEGRGMRGA